MDSNQWARLRALFDEALDRPEPTRAEWAAAATADDPALRAELMKLLTEERRASDALSRGALEHVPAWDPSTLVGRDVGGYTLDGVLGRGGMGVVYRARQRSPRRTVALKTLSSPLSSAKELSRFRLEVEVLGALQHRSIAQVFDAGTLAVDGRTVPYVAMELVEGGHDIVRHAREAGLDVRGKVALLREACEGVHHAHRRGIVHRDIKPGNLLVDPAGQVKVIDFGLARVADSAALGVSMVETLAGSVLGTLEYMSPEHVSGAPQDIDVRSDVFSLGCVLFELLTGRPPRELGGLGLSQAIQRIGSLEVRLPSNLPRPLRAVLARALALDPDQRYATAAEFGADLARFEHGESVLALRGQTFAAMAGFSRRHRTVILALVAVIAALSFGLYRTDRARRDALAAELETREEADVSLAIATSLGSLLASVQPFIMGREVKLVDVLFNLEEGLPLVTLPRARAALAAILGQAFVGMREFERAGPLLESATRELTELEGEGSPKRLLAVAVHADYLEQTGRYAESLEMSRAAYRLARERLGAEEHTTRYLATNTAVCLVRMGAFAEARDIYREAIEDALKFVQRNHAYEVATLERLAQVHISMNEPEDALRELDRAQEILVTTGGGRTLYAVALKSTRAEIVHMTGDREGALALHLETVAAYGARTDSIGNLLVAAINAGVVMLELGRVDDATELAARFRGRLVEAEREPGRYHSHWWSLEAKLACRTHDFAAARDHSRRALELGAQLVPTGWPDDHFVRRIHAAALRGLGDREGAVASLRDGLAIADRLFGAGSEQALELAWREVALLHELGRAAEAKALAQDREEKLRAADSSAATLTDWAARLNAHGRAFEEELSGEPWGD